MRMQPHVTPAKAGISGRKGSAQVLAGTPAFAGVTVMA